jgi:hypothetical protein
MLIRGKKYLIKCLVEIDGQVNDGISSNAGTHHMSTSAPTTSVPDERAPIEILDSDQNSTNKEQHYPVTRLLVPLVVVSAFSVTLGLLPYLRVRHHLVRHGRILERVDAGNRRLAEIIRSRDVNMTASRMQEHKSQSNMRLKLEQMEDKYRCLETVSREQATVLDSIRNQLEEANAREKELEQ